MAKQSLGARISRSIQSVKTQLSPEDHHALVLANHEREVARMGFQLKEFEWNQACERIIKAYRVDIESQQIDVSSGQIRPLEKIEDKKE